MSEASKEVSYTSDAATEFRMQSADGFPEGEYTVTVLVNGEPAGEREFRVAK
ncbi:hypothetical protein D3C83_280870 [compost metagenome]